MSLASEVLKRMNEVKMSDIIKKGDRDSEEKARSIIADMRKEKKSDKEIEKHLSTMLPNKLVKELLSESIYEGSFDTDNNIELTKQNIAKNLGKLSKSIAKTKDYNAFLQEMSLTFEYCADFIGNFFSEQGDKKLANKSWDLGTEVMKEMKDYKD